MRFSLETEIVDLGDKQFCKRLDPLIAILINARDYTIGERVNNIVSRMTLEEKVSQMVNDAAAIPRLDVPLRSTSLAMHLSNSGENL